MAVFVYLAAFFSIRCPLLFLPFHFFRDSAFLLLSLYQLCFDWEALEFCGFVIDAVSGGDLNRQF